VDTSSNHLSVPSRPSTEVTSKAKRRFFTAEYKRKILQEADACVESGQIGALLRREGLYSSHLVEWRRLRERGELAGLAPRKRGPRTREVNPLAKQLAERDREIARLKAENAKLQIICDVQKKVSQLLGVTLPTIPEDDESTKGRRPRLLPAVRPTSPRALDATERQAVRDVTDLLVIELPRSACRVSCWGPIPTRIARATALRPTPKGRCVDCVHTAVPL